MYETLDNDEIIYNMTDNIARPFGLNLCMKHYFYTASRKEEEFYLDAI